MPLSSQAGRCLFDEVNGICRTAFGSHFGLTTSEKKVQHSYVHMFYLHAFYMDYSGLGRGFPSTATKPFILWKFDIEIRFKLFHLIPCGILCYVCCMERMFTAIYLILEISICQTALNFGMRFHCFRSSFAHVRGLAFPVIGNVCMPKYGTAFLPFICDYATKNSRNAKRSSLFWWKILHNSGFASKNPIWKHNLNYFIGISCCLRLKCGHTISAAVWG